MDLIVRDARLRHRDGLADIGVAGGRIEAIAPRLGGGAAEEIDAAGHLTTPSFVEPHIHLDKALTSERARVIQDGFLPVFGTGDPLQAGLLLAFGAQFSSRASIETLYDMAALNGARIMRRPDHGLEVGARADLIVVDAPSVHEAYRTQPARLAVIHAGRVVARGGRVVDGAR